MSTYRITFRGVPTTFTTIQCNDLCRELVTVYKAGTDRQKNQAMSDILDLVKTLIDKSFYFVRDSNDRPDVDQEFRLGVLRAVEDFDENAGASFQTYLGYKLKDAFNRWRYYQSETVRSKDSSFKRKTMTSSMDSSVRNKESSQPHGKNDFSSNLAQKDFIPAEIDESEDFFNNHPTLDVVLYVAKNVISEKKYEILLAYVKTDGDMYNTALLIGCSRQYVDSQMKAIIVSLNKYYQLSVRRKKV